MLLAAVLFLITALGAGLVDTLGLLIVFPVIGGIGVGMASVIAPPSSKAGGRPSGSLDEADRPLVG